MQRSGLRGLFAVVAAVSAAALADPFVEAASNAGLFGRGNFTDHSSLDVIPALMAAALLSAAYVFLRARALVAAVPSAAARVRPLPLLPAIFAGQLAALYAMETLEQIAVAGHPLSGMLWLGAPAPVALALHGAACLLIALGLARALDAVTRAAAGVVLFVRAIFIRRVFARAPQAARRQRVAPGRRAHPLASRSGKRAPPFLAA